jgi:hypothetical protein
MSYPALMNAVLFFRYVSMHVRRTRAKGEINGKSANLNNALKNIIYQEYITKPGQIPLGELIVVFDADMQVCTQLPQQ